MNKEYERVKKDAAHLLSEDALKGFEGSSNELADQILSLEVYKDKTGKGYTIRDLIERGLIVADDQSLPKNPIGDFIPDIGKGQQWAYSEAQKKMLKPDSQGNVWNKVIPNPARTKELERQLQ